LGHLVELQVKLLSTLLRSISELDQAIAVTVLEHPKAERLQTLPRIDKLNLAQVPAEVGPIFLFGSPCAITAKDNCPPLTRFDD